MKIAVLMGGMSAERDVSLRSGKAVSEALLSKGYEAVTVDVDKNVMFKLAEIKPDLAFIALHGRYGEDGTIQGMLELMGIPYTGSGVSCSALCINKVLSKKLMSFENIPSAPFLVLNKHLNECSTQEFTQKILDTIGVPVVIKPSTQGSSIGTTIVRDATILEQAIEEALELDHEILAEKFISGTEITASVLGNEDPVALPIIEIEAAKGLYDYEAKYTPGASSHIIPARLSDEMTARVKEIALKTYKSFGCLGFSRIDMIVDPSGQPYVLEVNNIPGMTELSLFPDAAASYGLAYADLVKKLVDLAVDYWSKMKGI